MPKTTNKDAVNKELKDKEVVQKEATEQVEQESLPDKKGYVSYTLPFLPGISQGDVKIVTLNGRNYPVRYGVQEMVPPGVKEILDNMLYQSRLAEERIKEARKERCITKIEN